MESISSREDVFLSLKHMDQHDNTSSAAAMATADVCFMRKTSSLTVDPDDDENDGVRDTADQTLRFMTACGHGALFADPLELDDEVVDDDNDDDGSKHDENMGSSWRPFGQDVEQRSKFRWNDNTNIIEWSDEEITRTVNACEDPFELVPPSPNRFSGGFDDDEDDACASTKIRGGEDDDSSLIHHDLDELFELAPPIQIQAVRPVTAAPPRGSSAQSLERKELKNDQTCEAFERSPMVGVRTSPTSGRSQLQQPHAAETGIIQPSLGKRALRRKRKIELERFLSAKVVVEQPKFRPLRSVMLEALSQSAEPNTPH